MGDITINQIASFLGIISSIIGSMTAIITFVLKKVKKQIDENIELTLKPIHKEMKEIRGIINRDKQDYIDGILCVLRNEILSIYCKRKDKKKITMQEKQAINCSFKIYKDNGGNSFVEDIVEEMNTYKVID